MKAEKTKSPLVERALKLATLPALKDYRSMDDDFTAGPSKPSALSIPSGMTSRLTTARPGFSFAAAS